MFCVDCIKNVYATIFIKHHGEEKKSFLREIISRRMMIRYMRTVEKLPKFKNH